MAATPTEGDLDVLVVGGGIVGTGTALDAVTRGFATGLVAFFIDVSFFFRPLLTTISSSPPSDVRGVNAVSRISSRVASGSSAGTVITAFSEPFSGSAS